MASVEGVPDSCGVSDGVANAVGSADDPALAVAAGDDAGDGGGSYEARKLGKRYL